jgi:hypothetical protein
MLAIARIVAPGGVRARKHRTYGVDPFHERVVAYL